MPVSLELAVAKGQTPTQESPHRGSDQIATPTENLWNGYDLDKMVSRLHPIFAYLYEENITPTPSTEPHVAVVGATKLDIDMPVPKEHADAAPYLKFHPSTCLDYAIHHWGDAEKRIEKVEMEWENTLGQKGTYKQDALVVRSHGIDVAKIPIITYGAGWDEKIHGSGRYGEIYLPTDALSRKLRVAILLTAAQEASRNVNIEAVEKFVARNEKGVPHFRHIETNSRPLSAETLPVFAEPSKKMLQFPHRVFYSRTDDVFALARVAKNGRESVIATEFYKPTPDGLQVIYRSELVKGPHPEGVFANFSETSKFVDLIADNTEIMQPNVSSEGNHFAVVAKDKDGNPTFFASYTIDPDGHRRFTGFGHSSIVPGLVEVDEEIAERELSALKTLPGNDQEAEGEQVIPTHIQNAPKISRWDDRLRTTPGVNEDGKAYKVYTGFTPRAVVFAIR